MCLSHPNLRPVQFLLASSLFIAARFLCAAEAPAEGGTEFFVAKIEPIFRERCYKCHSHWAEKIKGGLVLDSRAARAHRRRHRTGDHPRGTGGESAHRGDPLRNEDLQMPPKGKKLDDEQIDAAHRMGEMGAPWPEEKGQKMTLGRGQDHREDRKWWAFQPLAKVEPPPARHACRELKSTDSFSRNLPRKDSTCAARG